MPKLANVPNISILSEVETASRALAPALKRLTKALGKLKLEELVLNSPGAAADLLYDLRQTSKLVPNLSAPFDDVLEPHIKSLEEHFIQRLEAGEASGVQGARSRVQVTVSAVPSVEDWAKFYAYIAKTKSFELLNKAPNRTAIAERWDAKKQVPGVGAFHVKKVSCTKLNGKGK